MCYILNVMIVEQLLTIVIILASHKGHTIQWTNQNSKQIHIAFTTRLKNIRARITIGFLLIGVFLN